MVQLSPTCSFRWVDIHGSNIIFVSGELILWYVNIIIIYRIIYLFNLWTHIHVWFSLAPLFFAKQSVTFHISATGRFLNEQTPYSWRSWQKSQKEMVTDRKATERKATKRNSHEKQVAKRKGERKKQTVMVAFQFLWQVQYLVTLQSRFYFRGFRGRRTSWVVFVTSECHFSRRCKTLELSHFYFEGRLAQQCFWDLDGARNAIFFNVENVSPKPDKLCKGGGAIWAVHGHVRVMLG